MTTISLHNYHQQIEQLVEERRLDEAVAHCRHILGQCPRHVDTYRALAKVLLERGEYQGAADLLQRVLSADPNDFIAHVGLSMVYKESADLPQSIWHLERALEIKPYNKALQDELRDLYTQNNMESARYITPSSGALVRLYLASEMYHAAIAETRQTLSQDEDRIDLQVLLAETLWRMNQRVEAVSLSLDILNKLPNCIQANAILSEIWLQTGRTGEAQVHLKHLQDLMQIDQAHCDDETIVCHAFRAPGAPPVPEEVTLEFLGEPQVETAVADVDWVQEFASASAEDSVTDGEADEAFKWLDEIGLADEGTAPVKTPVDAETEWFIDPGETADDDLSDLLGDIEDESAQLDEWLQGIDEPAGETAAAEPDESTESAALTDLLAELEADESASAEETDAAGPFTDIFADLEADEATLAEETDEDLPFTDIFADLEVDESSPAEEADEIVSSTDIFADLEEPETGELDLAAAADEPFGEGYTQLFTDLDDLDEESAGSETAEPPDFDADLAALAGAPESSPDESGFHTGFTQLFDEESADQQAETEAETDQLDSNWLLSSDGGLEPGADATAAVEDAPDWLSDSTESDFEPIQIDSRLTTGWLEESEEAAEEEAIETPADLSEEAQLWLENSEEDKGETADIPAWLLDDAAATEKEAIDSAEAMHPPEDHLPAKDDLAALAGDELSDWLAEEDEPDTAAVFAETGDDDLFEGSEDSLSWLLDSAGVSQDETEEFVADDNDERKIDSQDEQVEPEDSSYASRVAAGEGAPIDEPPTQISLPDEPEKPVDADDDLDWLDQLSDDKIEPTDEQITLDWAQEEPAIEEVLNGVTGELNADLDWLDALGEEADTKSADSVSEEKQIAAEEPVEPIEAAPADIGDLGEEAGEVAEELESPPLELDPLEESLAEAMDSGLLDPALALPEMDDLLAELPDEADDELTWLSALDAETGIAPDIEPDVEAIEKEIVLETAAADEPPEPDIDDVPDDLDDAMSWLEELAAKQGAPLEELPSIAHVVDETPSVEPELQVEEAPTDEAEVVSPESEVAPEPEISEPDIPEAEVAPQELVDALDWLEQVAREEGAPIDVEVQEITAASISEDDLEEALNWLEQLAQDEEMAETEPAASTADSLDDDEDTVFDLANDMPDDPDAAMAWLQQLATDESLAEDRPVEMEATAVESEIESEETEEQVDATTEEDISVMPAVAAEKTGDLLEAEMEIDPLAEMPDDPDEAMAWLEQLAARQGADLEELPSIDQSQTEAVMAETGVTETDEPVDDSADLAQALADVTPDVDDAADWLDDLVVEPGDPLADIPELADVLDMEPAAEITADVQEDFPDQVGDVDVEPDSADLDVPEDMDDAMAWLEELAEQQGAALEELPTLIDRPVDPLADELDTDTTEEAEEIEEIPPASLDTDVVEEPVGEETVAEESVGEEIWESEQLEPAAEEPVEEVEALAEDSDLSDLAEGDSDILPEWLDLDSDTQDLGQTDWLDTLAQPNVTGWLEEEQTTAASLPDSARLDSLPEPDLAPDTSSLPMDSDLLAGTNPLELPDDELAASPVAVEETVLNQARQAIQEGDYDQALQTYQGLVDAGGGMMILIADLEEAADEHTDQPLLRHLLGDAYMRNGQLQKALDTYRTALDQL